MAKKQAKPTGLKKTATTAAKQPIRWVRHRIPVPPGHALRMLAAPGTPADAAAVAIDLPDLKDLPSPLEIARFLLRRAAEVEHALLVQYLYAAYSLTKERGIITGIAIEEMWHLMTVQNLLLFLGAPPYLGRQDFGPPSGDQYRMFPFDLLLEPLSNASLAKYILAESPENANQADPVMAKVRELAGTALGGEPVNRVGTLYAFLGVVFGTEPLLLEKAADGDPWYQMVHRLAAVAAQQYGGRDKIHLPETAFHPESVAQQGTDGAWDRSVVLGHEEFRVQVAKERLQALEALRDIGLQGEGPSVVGQEQSHFTRFLLLFKTLFGADGSQSPSDLVHPVPRAAVIPIGESSDPNAITHPDTVPWAQLADLRYALLLGILEQYLVSAPADRHFLAAWAFAEMYHLKMLGDHLVSLPRSASVSAAKDRAALPFTMPPAEQLGLAARSAEGHWPAIHAERFEKAIQIVASLLPPPPAKTDSAVFLTHMLESDRRKLAEAKARQNKQSVRTQFDRVREILDWAAGTGSPKHLGTSPATGGESEEVPQRRFWNLSLEHFKQATIYGQGILEPTGGQQSDPTLVDELRRGRMPKGRPKLKPEGEEIAFIANWIKNGCPDTPLSGPGASGASH